MTGKLPELHIFFKKKGSKEDPNNYRPISVVSTIAKILEKHIKLELMNYMTNNNLLASSQKHARVLILGKIVLPGSIKTNLMLSFFNIIVCEMWLSINFQSVALYLSFKHVI